jgi:hypothetical protein
MNATLAVLGLAVSLNAIGMMGEHDELTFPRHQPSYHDFFHFWGKPLVARPVVDPYLNRHPIRVYNANKRILPPGPGYGWGFRNGAPDGYGWYDPGTTIPLGFQADRTDDYFFRRDFAYPPQQMFFPTYYNAFVMRGQRYIPYTNCGGFHPAGGAASGSSMTPVQPYDMAAGRDPVVQPPTFSGVQSARPLPPQNFESSPFQEMP